MLELRLLASSALQHPTVGPLSAPTRFNELLPTAAGAATTSTVGVREPTSLRTWSAGPSGRHEVQGSFFLEKNSGESSLRPFGRLARRHPPVMAPPPPPPELASAALCVGAALDVFLVGAGPDATPVVDNNGAHGCF